ncbi:hypothetical protein KL86APRO_11657 [uncultured Alphaproteobacteria bacterium]|uniref:Uncharacterized protein n=1 Tax=uncultured Alphaproteobacteria bacterium TaxID=91750 RepID=A0A212JU77_9PROT|nr:hypothetical protein KL86APRO_11657 [uncultured Alphaproteobacteria bacterium]
MSTNRTYPFCRLLVKRVSSQYRGATRSTATNPWVSTGSDGSRHDVPSLKNLRFNLLLRAGQGLVMFPSPKHLGASAWPARLDSRSADKSQLARRISELKRLKRPMKGPLAGANCAPLERNGACRSCSDTGKARSPAQWQSGRDCCAPPTPERRPWTKSVNRDWMGRR